MLKKTYKFLKPISDYCKTRRNYVRDIIICLLISIAFLIYFLLFDIKQSLNIQNVYFDFINTMVNGIAILLSFSIAILTVYITSDGENIEKLKKRKAFSHKYKPLNKSKDKIEKIGDNKRITLYQVILSGVTYDILIEMLFLLFLFLQMFLRTVLNNGTYKFFVCIDIFFILHIFVVLYENIVNMYLSFWSNSTKLRNDKEKSQ